MEDGFSSRDGECISIMEQKTERHLFGQKSSPEVIMKEQEELLRAEFVRDSENALSVIEAEINLQQKIVEGRLEVAQDERDRAMYYLGAYTQLKNELLMTQESSKNPEMEKVYQGAIVVFYKDTAGDRQYLVVDNAKTGNKTFVSGAAETVDGSAIETAQREIEEELGIVSDQYELKATGVTQEFVFGDKKPERAGAKGIYQVFLADVSHLPEVLHTKELKGVTWLSQSEARDALTFDDLKDVFDQVLEG